MKPKEEEKEFVWLPKSIAKKLKDIEKPESALSAEIINEYIKDVKTSMRVEVESLDEDVQIFKGLMIQARQRFEDAKNAQLEASYKLWEDFEAKLPGLEEKVDIAIRKLKPLEIKCNELSEIMQKIDSFKIERLAEAIAKLSTLYEENQKMVNFLICNYKKED